MGDGPQPGPVNHESLLLCHRQPWTGSPRAAGDRGPHSPCLRGTDDCGGQGFLLSDTDPWGSTSLWRAVLCASTH